MHWWRALQACTGPSADGGYPSCWCAAGYLHDAIARAEQTLPSCQASFPDALLQLEEVGTLETYGCKRRFTFPFLGL